MNAARRAKHTNTPPTQPVPSTKDGTARVAVARSSLYVLYTSKMPRLEHHSLDNTQ